MTSSAQLGWSRVVQVLCQLSVAAALGCVLTVWAAGAASAHAVLGTTSPPAGAVLPASPAQVSLTFDEAVGPPAFVTVTGPNGRIDNGPAHLKGPVVSELLRASTTPGRYTVAYRVISDDGHPVQSSFSYQIGTSQASGKQAAVAGAPASGTGSPNQGHVGAWALGIVGGAVILLGILALAWERLRRDKDARSEASV